MSTIKVLIEIKEFDGKVYLDTKNCYLSQALRKMGFKEVSVGGFGECIINNKHYRTSEDTPFNGIIAQMVANSETKSITIKLKEYE